MISAEKFAYIPPSNGIYEWSPLLEKTGRTITYWKVFVFHEGSNGRASENKTNKR